MSKNWSFVPGQWWFICDSCGQKMKSDVSKKRWDGFRVCPECYENRHPQDFLRSRPDRQLVPWSRPLSTDVFQSSIANLLDTIDLTEVARWVNTKEPATPSDSMSIGESVATTSAYFRLIPGSTTSSNGVLNGSHLNDFALNGYDQTITNNSESITIGETVVASQGFGRTASDSVTLGESVTTFKFLSNPLNYTSLNSLALG